MLARRGGEMLVSYRETGVTGHLLPVELEGTPFSLFTSTVVVHLLKVQLHLFNRFSCSGLRGLRQPSCTLQTGWVSSK